MSRPTNRNNIINSHKVIEAIEELEMELDSYTEARGDARDALDEELARKRPRKSILAKLESELATAEQRLLEWESGEEAEELKQLKKLADDAEGYTSDWSHGAQLIRDSHFEEYAQEFAEDIGAIDRKVAWPYTCIDWERAARELQMDYTAVEFDGVTYWVR